MKGKIRGFLFTAVVVLSACRTSKVADTPKANIRDVINSPDVTLVDVRIPEQYAEGTVKNALNIPLAEIQSNIDALRGKKVVVFCNRGLQADQAMETLKKNGIETYDGTSWKNVKAIQKEKSAERK